MASLGNLARSYLKVRKVKKRAADIALEVACWPNISRAEEQSPVWWKGRRKKLVLRGPQIKKKADKLWAQPRSRANTLKEEAERTQGKLGLKGRREELGLHPSQLTSER